jgi:UDP-2,3-diacylglucosamine hydrolase
MKTPVYFISDIHLKLNLDESEKKRRQNLFKLLDHIINTGGTCFFVGDLFDFYFEYPDLIPKVFNDFYQKALYMKSKNVDLHFLAGNHDYWVGDFIKNEIMDTIYLNDAKLKINNKKIYITHGDGLLSWDHGYRLLKTIIRSSFFTQVFKWLHPTIAYKLARFISRSGNRNTHNDDFNADVRRELKNSAEKIFENGFDFMITGHYHLGEIFKLKKGKLAVLGDWFFRPSYAIFDGEDLELKNWESIE